MTGSNTTSPAIQRNRTEVFEACWELEPATVKQIAAHVSACSITVRRHLAALQNAGEVFVIDGHGNSPDLWVTTKTDAHRRAAAARARELRASELGAGAGGQP